MKKQFLLIIILSLTFAGKSYAPTYSCNYQELNAPSTRQTRSYSVPAGWAKDNIGDCIRDSNDAGWASKDRAVWIETDDGKVFGGEIIDGGNRRGKGFTFDCWLIPNNECQILQEALKEIPARDYPPESILSATYGYGFMKKNVLGTIRQNIGKRIQAGGPLFGSDPLPSTVKVVTIIYQDEKGKKHTLTYKDGRTIPLTSPEELIAKSAPLDEAARLHNAQQPLPTYRFNKAGFTFEATPHEMKFLNAGSPPALIGSEEFDERRDTYSADIFTDAAQRGFDELISMLRQSNFDINAKDPQDQQTALMKTAIKGDAKAVKLLLKAGANPRLKDALEKTAEDLASKSDVKNIFEQYKKVKIAASRQAAEKIISGKGTLMAQQPASETIKEFLIGTTQPQTLTKAVIPEDSIVRATYGAGDRTIDVTDRIRSALGKILRVANDYFQSDPAPGTVKELVIVYRDHSGNEKTATFREGRTISLASLEALDEQSAPVR